MYKEFRQSKQRLAVFEDEIIRKINVLFDADESKREFLEVHDMEIPEIKSELFEHDIRIKNLEKKVIGA